MKKFFKEFKAFIAKGNIVDLAVAVIIGGAFNKIVSSLVNDIIMPLVSLMVGGKDVTDWKWIIRKAEYDANGNVLIAESALKYGMFIQTVIDFLIIALTVFLIVKIFKASRQKFYEIGQTVITETKELTKKQIKTLKKLQKKSKKGAADENLEAQAHTIISQVAEVKENATNSDTNNTKNETAEIVKSAETQKFEENNDLSNESNLQDTELLCILKEIRDTLKSNQNTKND